MVPCTRSSPYPSKDSFLTIWKKDNIKCCFNYDTDNLHVYGCGPIYSGLFNDPIKEKIKSITIGSNITEIVKEVFSGCTSLESVVM